MDTLHDKTISRRALMSAVLGAGATGTARAAPPASGAPGPTPATEPAAPNAAARERLRALRAPNAPLVDHRGRTINFYDDVIRDRTVLISVMYTVCSNICTPATRHLIEARRILRAEGRELQFVSISLTPLDDTPQALRDYKKLHGIDEGWTFLTGKPENVERVQRALGFLGTNGSDDLLSHSAMARLCDERNLRWGHVNTLLSPRSIARMIRFELA